jgi:hypothetical protein
VNSCFSVAWRIVTRKFPASSNTVHFTIWMAVMKSTRVVVCGARGRSG